LEPRRWESVPEQFVAGEFLGEQGERRTRLLEDCPEQDSTDEEYEDRGDAPAFFVFLQDAEKNYSYNRKPEADHSIGASCECIGDLVAFACL